MMEVLRHERQRTHAIVVHGAEYPVGRPYQRRQDIVAAHAGAAVRFRGSVGLALHHRIQNGRKVVRVHLRIARHNDRSVKALIASPFIAGDDRSAHTLILFVFYKMKFAVSARTLPFFGCFICAICYF